MRRTVTRAAGVVAAVGGTALLGALSRTPLSAYPDPAPLVRLAWSVRPERIETCRTLSDAELADVPAHMRQRVQCEGRSAEYRLSVRIDDRLVLDTLVRGGGARNDRPVYVFREVAVAAGPHELEVRFAREALPGDSAQEEEHEEAAGDTLLGARAAREAEERLRRREEAIPPELELDATLTSVEREVQLVTYDVDRRALVLRTRPAAP